VSFNIKVGDVYNNCYALKGKTLMLLGIETCMNCVLLKVTGEARKDIMLVDV
jgi:hypothetical protein